MCVHVYRYLRLDGNLNLCKHYINNAGAGSLEAQGAQGANEATAILLSRQAFDLIRFLLFVVITR